MQHFVTVPAHLALEETIRFGNHLTELPKADEYFFDFGNMRRIDPFAMLYLSKELKRYRETKPESKFFAINYDKNTYSAHMGFYKAFGLDYGKAPGEATGSSTYIPITIMQTSKIRDSARIAMQAPGSYLQLRAMELSTLLTRNSSGPLFDAMSYSLREILRNVLEHSTATNLGLCAQYWPTLRKVALAITDDGRGLKESLRGNPNLYIENDEAALRLALQPGISGTFYEGAYADPDDPWTNSGYGLYMTSMICRDGGSFYLQSGSKGIYLSEKRHVLFETRSTGTALNLVLNIDRLKDLNEMLEKYRQDAKVYGASSPSASSKSLYSY